MRKVNNLRMRNAKQEAAARGVAQATYAHKHSNAHTHANTS